MWIDLWRSISVALILFVAIGVVGQLQLPISETMVDYLEFVLTTDFGTSFLTMPYQRLRLFLAGFDFTQLIQGLPRIAVGW